MGNAVGLLCSSAVQIVNVSIMCESTCIYRWKK